MLELKPSGIQQFYSQKFNKIIITEINTKKKTKKDKVSERREEY